MTSASAVTFVLLGCIGLTDGPTGTIEGRFEVRTVAFGDIATLPFDGTVFVEGTRFGATADAPGRFRIACLPVGRYVLRLRTPTLDARDTVDLAEGQVVRREGVLSDRLARSYDALRDSLEPRGLWPAGIRLRDLDRVSRLEPVRVFDVVRVDSLNGVAALGAWRLGPQRRPPPSGWGRRLGDALWNIDYVSYAVGLRLVCDSCIPDIVVRYGRDGAGEVTLCRECGTVALTVRGRRAHPAYFGRAGETLRELLAEVDRP